MRAWRALLLLAIASAILLAGCEASGERPPQERIVKLLTAKKMEGRLAGTAGNEEAVQAIGEEFARIGLEKYSGDDYRVLFPYQAAERKEISLKVTMKDGSVKELVYGKHFRERVIRMDLDAAAELMMGEDSIDSLTAGTAFVAASEEELDRAQRRSTRFILARTDMFKPYPARRNLNVPVVDINDDTYGFLKKKQEEIESISLRMKYEDKEEAKAASVIGKISGTSASGPDHHVLVLSAPLDSLGSDAGKVYEGASRAAAVSVLAGLAESLKALSEERPFYSDIIFCAFNGRENGLQGSQELVNSIYDPHVHISAVNLDAMGVKGSKLNLLADNTRNRLVTSLADELKQGGFNAETRNSFDGDHASFGYYSLPAVSFGLEEPNGVRTVRDRAEDLDYGELSRISGIILDFVQKQDEEAKLEHNHAEAYPFGREKSMYEYQDVKQQLVQREMAKLAFKQYELFENKEQDIRELVSNPYQNMEKEEFQNRYPGYSLPQSVGGYSLRSVIAILDEKAFGAGNVDELEPNRIYTSDKTFEKKDINELSLSYEGKNGSVLFLSVLNGEGSSFLQDSGMIPSREVMRNGLEFTIYDRAGTAYSVLYPFNSGGKDYKATLVAYVMTDTGMSPKWELDDAETAALLKGIDWKGLA
ncbi:MULTISPECIES: M28 family peptidase [unclassified Paenibacillus]|uniref:M28 family metallopeptidase n=1 Tax=unclassified Paenibacillus TaxID=185978 RepID=UPI000953FDE4|nr:MULTISPECIES: M28 family peptidase [unclassified Paenibacillus]ASS67949.1 Zn-dependent exopeptidase M28 [Paenibacillus sp. RUD330]SIR43097.1 Peptidase family M28 [Paenibacillus sp. RU4X]SIR53119.1 Peptidase family M28 [Paenibacillus sp. RU4T]